MWISRRKGDPEAEKLKSQWSNLPYGSQAARVAMLQEWFARRGVSGTRQPMLKRPAAAMEVGSRTTLPYQGGGFQAGTHQAQWMPLSVARGLLQACVVTKPLRHGSMRILEKVSLVIFDGIAHKGSVFVSDMESTPLRPLILLYGENKPSQMLRHKYNLSEDNVFILGNDADGESNAVCPFVTQWLFGGSPLYNASHLLYRAATMPWHDRPCLLAFMSKRGAGRWRAHRSAFVKELVRRIAKGRPGWGRLCWTLGQVHARPAISKRNWARRIEAESGASNHLDSTVSLHEHAKVTIAIENDHVGSYVSEKSILPLLAGSVPIVWGPKVLSRLIHPNAMVDCTGCELDNPTHMAEVAFQKMEKFLDGQVAPPAQGVAEDVFGWYSKPPLAPARQALQTWLTRVARAADA